MHTFLDALTSAFWRFTDLIQDGNWGSKGTSVFPCLLCPSFVCICLIEYFDQAIFHLHLLLTHLNKTNILTKWFQPVRDSASFLTLPGCSDELVPEVCTTNTIWLKTLCAGKIWIFTDPKNCGGEEKLKTWHLQSKDLWKHFGKG